METNLRTILDSKKRLDNQFEEGLRDLRLWDVDPKETLQKALSLTESKSNAAALEMVSHLLKSLELDCKMHSVNKKTVTNTPKHKDSSDGDNVVDSSAEKSSSRSRRKAFTDASKSINQQVNVSLSTKLRNDTDIKIKTERISEVLINPTSIKEDENMPPPTLLPKRGRKKNTSIVKVERASARPTRTRGTNKILESTTNIEVDTPNSFPKGKTSDVILIQENIDTITLDGGGDENEAKEHNTESTRKWSDESSKRTRSSSPEVAAGKRARPKRTKRTKKETGKVSDASVYEDAVNILPGLSEIKTNATVPQNNKTDTIERKTDTIERKSSISQPTVVVNQLPKGVIEEHLNKNPNATITISKTIMNETIVIKKDNNKNETVVLEKPTVLNQLSDLMTDDEDSIGTEMPPQVLKTKQVNKQLFSPFENSPVKKKVEAFEKLGATTIGARVTRNNTKHKDKKSEADLHSKLKSPLKQQNKPGYVTPTSSARFIPALVRSNSTLSDSAKKALSAFKLKNNVKDYDQLRQEKETEALKKKEAMLNKQTEERRRKREEKEKKAKQQRETMEKEKQRLHEMQKELKLEKQEKLQQEKLELQQKQREETEKRRLLAKQKQEELKREAERKLRIQDQLRDEANRLLEQKAKQQAYAEPEKIAVAPVIPDNHVPAKPIYMRQREPLLPTPDCYDSDDDNAVKHPQLPEWNSKESISEKMRLSRAVNSKLQNTLFCLKAKTPNLQEMMPSVDPRKLRRNSSAIWKKIPRFTMMSQLHEDNF